MKTILLLTTLLLSSCATKVIVKNCDITIDMRPVWSSMTNYIMVGGKTTTTYNAGDTISFSITNQTAQTFTTLVSAADNWMTITRVGN